MGRYAELILLPILTNGTSDIISRSSFLIVGAGYVLSLICDVEVIDILESSWHQNSLLESVPLLLVHTITIASVCSSGLVLLHMQLSTGEIRCRRWWKAFLSFGFGAPFGLFLFFSSISWQLLVTGNWDGHALLAANLISSLVTGLWGVLTLGTLGLVLIFMIYYVSSRTNDACSSRTQQRN